MWRDICLCNREAILEAVQAFEDMFLQFKEMIETRNGEGLEERFQESRSIRAGIPLETNTNPSPAEKP